MWHNHSFSTKLIALFRSPQKYIRKIAYSSKKTNIIASFLTYFMINLKGKMYTVTAFKKCCPYPSMQRMEGMLFCTDNNIIMSRNLIIRGCVLFLEEEVQFHPNLSLKIGSGDQIHKFPDFKWSSACKRWQRTAEAVIPWPTCPALELELYCQGQSTLPVVVAEGSIPVPTISACLRRQIRISLLTDGLYVGCLFCLLDDRPEDHASSGNFLYLHKIDIILLENIEHSFQIHLHNNDQLIYEKHFHLHYKKKALFPNIKIPARMSDVITVTIDHSGISIREVKFVVDSVKRGKTSTYEAWLRNPIKNKIGDIKIEYFLENLFLDNERQIFARNGIYPNRVSRNSHKTPVMSEQEKDRLRRSVIIRQLQQADLRIIKISTSVRRMMKNIQNKQNRSTVNNPSREYRGTLRAIEEQ